MKRNAIRDAAFSAGEKHYFTGKPCKHGHVAARWTSIGACTVCIEIAKRAYRSTDRGKETQRAYDRRRYADNAESIRAYSAAYHHQNKESKQQYWLRYYSENRERLLKAGAEWRTNNPERVLESAARWRENNPDAEYSKTVRRRAAKKMAYRPWDSELLKLVEAEALDVRKRREKITGFAWHIDHIVPLRSKFVCGLHNEFNLAVIPARDNSKKANVKWPYMP